MKFFRVDPVQRDWIYSFVEVPGSVASLARISSRFPPIYPNNAKNPGDQPWVLCIVEVPGIEPGSVQASSVLLRV